MGPCVSQDTSESQMLVKSETSIGFFFFKNASPWREERGNPARASHARGNQRVRIPHTVLLFVFCSQECTLLHTHLLVC